MTADDPTPPHFVLASENRSLTAHGTAAVYADPYAAAAALRAGRIDAVVGALAFDRGAPAHLTVPHRLRRDTFAAAPTDLPALHPVAEHPTPTEHLTRVRRAVDLIDAGHLQKVVLARSVDFAAENPIPPLETTAALRDRDAAGNAFAVHLGPERGWLVGSSPEILVERHGDRVRCHPLAGTATSPDGLLDSAKDRAEHAYVVDEIAAALAPLCTGLDVPRTPSVTQAGPVWHLGSPIVGRLADPSTSALDLALALHPTAAVCGVPRQDAAHAIARLEDDRGYYAGAVGWTDARGNGHWRVAIRCALIAPDGSTLRAFAGGGIVATSDPHAELIETENKMRTVLGPFQTVEAAAVR